MKTWSMPPPPRRRPARRRLLLPPRAGGYNLVILVMTITVLNIMVAAALPSWTGVIRRHKEAELIFRGLQYAEAIRVFQGRFNRPPTRLEELLETKPRSIRQLWDNPMSDDGSWGLIMASANPQEGQQQGGGRLSQLDPSGRIAPVPAERAGGRGGRAGRDGRPGDEAIPRGGGRNAQGELGKPTAHGPIQGVFSPEGGTAMRTFLDSKEIADWRFTVELIAGATGAMLPETQQPVPMSSANIGRPWPPGVVPPAMQGRKGGEPPPGQHPPGPDQQPQPRPRRR